METKIRIIRPGQEDEIREIDLPNNPGYDVLEKTIRPILDGHDLEHVSVLADFLDGTDYRRADMFVDETGSLRGLPMNEAATVIYRRAWMMRYPRSNPAELPYIYGTAVIFNRIVWR